MHVLMLFICALFCNFACCKGIAAGRCSMHQPVSDARMDISDKHMAGMRRYACLLLKQQLYQWK